MDQTVIVGTILAWLDTWAPFDSAEEWDNVGLLVGDAEMPVTKVLTSLDVTPSVMEQASAMNAELIISHHPVIFRPLTKLTGGDMPYRLIQNGIAFIGAHTNLDKADGGVNDVLAAYLQLQDIHKSADGLCRIGKLKKPMEPAAFAEWVGDCLHVPKGGIQRMNGSQPVQTVDVCSGAGGDYASSLLSEADAFVTGELHYHEWPVKTEKTIVAAGHFYTEVIIAKALAERLQEAFPMLTVKAAKEQCPYQ